MDKKYLYENIDLLEGQDKEEIDKEILDDKSDDLAVMVAKADIAANKKRIKEAKARKKERAKYRKVRQSLKEELTDYDLLNLLEAGGFEVTYENLRLLKEGIESGNIILEEEAPEEEVGAEEIPSEEGEMQPRRSATVTPDGTVQMNAENIEVVATPDGSMSANLYEAEEVVEGQEEIHAEEAPEEGSEEYAEQSAEMAPPRVSISMPIDGSMQIDNCGKQVVADAEGNVNVSLAESKKFLYAKNTERFLKSYLTEDCQMSEKEYAILTEETKIDSVRDIAASLLQTVEQKIISIDTTPADRSRGDVKQLKELSSLQDSITQLETIIERDENASPEYSEAVATIIKSILYMNQYSAVFKDAYRNKKTVMILKYQSLVLSIISSVSYLISAIIDFKSGEVKLKTLSQDVLDFAPLKSLAAFVKSVDSGEFKTITKDVNVLREYYLEVPVETMSAVLESYEQIDMVVNGVKNIYNQLTNGELGSKVTDILYKAVGVIVLLFSLRDTFYTLFRMKTRVSDMTGIIHQFSNLNIGGNIVNKLAQFTNKFRADAENSSDISKKEIEEENKKVLGQVKQVQATNSLNHDEEEFKPESLISNPTIDNGNTVDFGFDF